MYNIQYVYMYVFCMSVCNLYKHMNLFIEFIHACMFLALSSWLIVWTFVLVYIYIHIYMPICITCIMHNSTYICVCTGLGEGVISVTESGRLTQEKEKQRSRVLCGGGRSRMASLIYAGHESINVCLQYCDK